VAGVVGRAGGVSETGGATIVDIGSNGHDPTPGQQTIGGGEVQSVYVEQIRVDGTTQVAIDFCQIAGLRGPRVCR
jgi:hypothetical protein